MTQAFEKLLSIVVVILGLFVMGGWLLNPRALELVSPNLVIMVFNTAFCFVVTGAALLTPESSPSLRRSAHRLAGVFLIVFASAILVQDVLGIHLGLDQLFTSASMDDYNPHPGRMAPPTAMCFILCGCAFLLLHIRQRRFANIALQSISLLVMGVSIIGITAASVRFELLYSWYQYGRMAIPTAICFLIISVVLWLIWYRTEARAGASLQGEEKRISVTGILIIVSVALSAGMSGFGILANQMEHTLEVSLKETESNHLELVQNNIDLGVSGALPVTTRLLMNRYLAVLNLNPDDELAKQVIRSDAESFLSANFPAVSIYTRNGTQVAQVGSFTTDPDMQMPLQLKDTAKADLLWKNGAILKLSLDILVKGEKIGSAVVERNLPYVSDFLLKKGYLGETAETRICYAVDAGNMHCLPSNRHPQVFAVEPRVRERQSTSMDLALKNQNGILLSRDYMDHEVVAAYAPVADMGLGMVVKIDAAEFYGPIRERLQYAVGLVLLLSAIGIAIQHLQLLPLIKRLVGSEERLRSVNQFHQTLLDSANFTIIASDRNGIIRVFNKTAEKMLGYTAEEVIGKKTPGIFHDPERIKKRAAQLTKELGVEIKPGIETFIAKARIHGSDEHEWLYIRKDGTSYPVLLSVSCLYNAAGEVTGSLGLGIDITERKRLEKLKNEFISTVSHELRTPLTSIRGSLGLMKAGVVGEIPPKAKEMTEIAYKNCDGLILLINDILDIDKIESGEMRFDIKDENINGLVQQAVEANVAYGEKFEIRFVVESLISAAYVNVDSSRLIQVLSNLLSNAAKFSHTGSEVLIGIMRHNGKVWVYVTDKGPGIPEEFHSRIFNKFAQADSSSTRKKSGTGLGLNISKQIMERMGGTIEFTSKIGEGTTFRISLPEVPQPEFITQLEDAIEYLSADNTSSLPRILHAEDDYDFCRVISHSLQGKAIVHIAATVTDASKLLQSNFYDLMILDLSLPDGTGLRLLQQIQEKQLSTTVMILSASEVDEKIRKKVAMAIVKSTISEDKIIENILALANKNPVT